MCGQPGPERDARRASYTAAWLTLAAAALVGLSAGVSRADDWPVHAHDNNRSGVTAEKLPATLGARWVFESLYPPSPAWAGPKEVPVEGLLELRRVHFDDAFQVAIARQRVYFGSSADNKLYALDLESGRIVWTKIMGGPIRLAPAVWEDRLYLGTDDGYVYCLSAADGAEVWRFHAAPEDQRVLGRGKMISLWPARTGVLVDGGIAYFTAGVFPAEGVFLYAVDARTGKLIWKNDSCGESPQSRIAPQGYMLASQSTLYVPMGRVSPAAFDRETGRLLSAPTFGKTVGGTYALLADNYMFTGTEEMVAQPDVRGSGRFAIFGARKLVVKGERAFMANGERLIGLNRETYPAAARKVQAARGKKEASSRAITMVRKELSDLQRSIDQLKAEIDALQSDGGKSSKLRDQVGKLQDELAAKTKKLQEAKAAGGKQKQATDALDQDVAEAEAALAMAFSFDVPCKCDQALILADDLLVAGGAEQVVAYDSQTGQIRWSVEVSGQAKGLAVADGRLLVSTDKGLIYCFGSSGGAACARIQAPVATQPFVDESSSARFRRAAESVLRSTGVRRGFCLVLGCETGALALELARQSDLTVYAVSPDAEKVAAARRAIDAAGMYGARVCVEQWPLDHVPYADYFANLIVSETAIIKSDLPDVTEVCRMLKPMGGVALLGSPDPDGPSAASLAGVLPRWLAEAGKAEGVQASSNNQSWVKLVRGALPGAGGWTHQYGNPGNTACGDDERVRAPLGVLWFGDPGPGKNISRHARAASPLSIDGRLFCQGDNYLMAYDAYNGVKLWDREIPGAVRPTSSHDGSNMAVNHQALFVALPDKCLRLDPATGETVQSYDPPPRDAGQPVRWGILACEGNLLYGSRSAPGSQESDCVFALDIATGRLAWTYEAKKIPHNSIAIDGGRLFLVHGEVDPADRQAVVDRKREAIAKLPEADRPAALRALAKPDVRGVVCLDAIQGKLLWHQAVDLANCGSTNVAAMAHNGVLVVFGVYLDGHYWKQFFAGEFAARRAAAFSTEDGKLLWSQAAGYRVRPVIVGDTLYAEPWAFQLHTGEAKMRVNPISGQSDRWQFARPGHHCGCPNAAPHCLFFRSFCLGYYNLDDDFGTQHFGAQRPGCWINFIPANGLLLFPESSTGCLCPFPNQCTVAFKPVTRTKGFGYYSASGPTTPVRRLGIHFGAAGDRRDTAGDLWLGYPRPGGSLVLPLKIDVGLLPGGEYQARSSSYTPIAGTSDPWLFAAAARGLSKCQIPLLKPGDGTALYRVRLAFCDPDNDLPGCRVFDVRLQGKTVLEGCDIARETGGRDRSLWKEFSGVEVHDDLLLELVSKTAADNPSQAPILQAVEIVQQKVLSLGCVVPEFEVSKEQPKQSGQIQLTNIREEPVRGTLHIKTPSGFTASPARTQIKLQPGDKTTVDVEVAVAKNATPGEYRVSVKLTGDDGTVQADRTAALQYLGPRRRVTLRVIEDAHVVQRYPEQNKGTSTVLLVDGGVKTMGDESHTVAYLKFRMEKLPGRLLSATLRIHNAGNPSSNGGRICLVTEPWTESEINYLRRPAMGQELARIGKVETNAVVECKLPVEILRPGELSLAIDPLNCDGVTYVSREGRKPPELVIEYETE